MTTTDTARPRIATREEWLTARQDAAGRVLDPGEVTAS